jgi:hypothetical protein
MLQHDDHRFSHGRDGFGELLLRLRDDDLGPGLRFARHIGAFADREDDHIRPPSRRDRLRDAAGQRFFDSGARGDDQPGLVGNGCAHAGSEIDRLGIVAIDDPRADEVVLPGGERPDQRDALPRARQRQEVAVVLEKNDRFASGLA